MHRRIERNPKAAKLAKRLHGTSCQCCGFDFLAKYGALGSGYIEAHHLVPLSHLQEGLPVRYDLANDFAVLCANCHRMIHRLDDASDLKALRAACSLAHVMHANGDTKNARALLEPIYSWFTEGHETTDLKNAKALLDEMA